MTANSASTKPIYASIVKFLDAQLKLNASDADLTESLEVAKQCLETASGVTESQVNEAKDLMQILTVTSKTNIPTEKEKEEAETKKMLGNQQMKDEKYQEAIDAYTDALKLWPDNPIYLCNRAAAYTKLEKHHETIADCKRAIEIDTKYSKAWSRMGLAFSSLNQHKEAVDAYKRALELDPNNQAASQNLAIAQARLAHLGGAGAPGAGGNVNMEAIGNMARQLMQDPNMQNMFSNFIGSSMQQNRPGPDTTNQSNPASTPSAPTEGAAPSAQQQPPMDMNNLFSLGQQLLGNMQRDNPEMLSNLMEKLGGAGGPGANPGNQ